MKNDSLSILKFMKYLSLLFTFVLAITSCSENLDSEDDLISKAKAIHEKVITIDTHCDIDVENFTDSKNYLQDVDAQVTLPKMQKGGLDVAWFIVYTGQESLNQEGYDKAYEEAMSKFNAIHRLTEDYAPDQIELAFSSDDIKRIHKSGKKIAMIGVENGYPIATDIGRVKEFYDLGARYMSLAHNGHSQLSDSNTGEENDVWLHDGLSGFGKKVVIEMNKYGMMIDVSHPSKEAMREMIKLSNAPIIASHSSARALCDHSRNLDDEQLDWMKENGGVVQAVAFAAYINTEKAKEFSEKSKELYNNEAAKSGFKILSYNQREKLSPEGRESYRSGYNTIKEGVKDQIDSLNEAGISVNVSDFVDHIDYMVKKIGVEHVGISSDFDGGGGIYGWDDASETFNVTLELVKRAYTEEQIALLWGGNLMRVLDDVQRIAGEIQTKNVR